MLNLVESWQAALARHVAAAFEVELDPGQIPFTFPPKPEMGDAATPIAFSLAKRLKRPPAEIAGVLSRTSLEAVRETQVKGGFLNLFLNREEALRTVLEERLYPTREGKKVIVEHTNINPNKAAHVGHLRNAVLGDTLVRCLRALGSPAEAQNYIDDTGVQVADVVVGFHRILGLGLHELEAFLSIYQGFSASDAESAVSLDRLTAWLRAGGWKSTDRLPALTTALKPILDDSVLSNLVLKWIVRSKGRFDGFCWDLYAHVTAFYGEADERLQHRREVLHLIEEGENEIARMAERLAAEIVNCHLMTMDRLSIRYDLLPHESDILRRGFWSACRERLRERGVIEKVDDDSEDKNRGCWIMRLSDAKAFKGLSDADKVIVRSDGTVTYIGKDLAYQTWKFGLLGRDFHYRRAPRAPYPVWRSHWMESEPGAPPFGNGDTVYNVIDVRQSYLQKIVKEGLRQLGHAEESERSIHFAYEMVALSQETASEFAATGDLELTDEDRSKPFVEMSGRKGLGIQADLLLDRLEEKAREEILKRDGNLDPEEARSRALMVSIAALRYYMVKFARNQIVAFDMERALAFEGETGPYLQYACVRAENILRKAAERGEEEVRLDRVEELLESVPLLDEDAWSMLTLFLRLPLQVRSAVEGLDLNQVAKNLCAAAQAFHTYYHHYPVLQEEDPGRRRARLVTVALFAGLLRENLRRLLGIPVPERM